MKYGVQMYAIRTLCMRDLEKGIRAAAEIGYEGLEFAGFFGHSAEQVAAWLEKYHVQALGAHIMLDEICGDTDAVIAYQKKIGNCRIVCPWTDIKTAEDVAVLVQKLRAVQPKLAAAGMELYYHNHAHEFLNRANGEYLLDLLAQQVPELRLELDVYWIWRGGADPMVYLKKYEGRTGIFHAKDGNLSGGTLAGAGEVDLRPVCAYAKQHQFDWAIVESEASEDEQEQLDAIRKDYQYIRSL